jgi:uncharacterized protein YbjT (DUF2867 family)
MITIMGATGQTGKKIAGNLLKAGEKIRALGRSETKLAELARLGAEVLAGDTMDADFLARAFRDSAAVYTLVAVDPQSPDYRAAQDKQGEAIVHAIRASGVRHVVALSSLGAELENAPGVLAGLHAQEERLKGLTGVNVTLLRPASFFENFRERIPMFKYEGINGDVLSPDLQMPMVATRDIAAVASKALMKRDATGMVVHELLGPRDTTHTEITRIIGERIGRRDLQYVQFPESDMIAALVQAGLSESFARQYIEMARAMNNEQLKPLHGRTPANTTRTPFDEVADEIAAAYKAL